MNRITSYLPGASVVSTLARAAVLAASLLVLAAPASAQRWTATLSGPAEEPPNASPGTGFVFFELNGDMLSIDATFSGLIGTSTVAHVHCCTATPFAGTAGVATPTPTFPGFPAGVTSGDYFEVFDLTEASSYNATFVTNNGGVMGARDALIAGFNNGTAYFNLHSMAFPGGEIRGFVTVVPEPSTFALLGGGLMFIVAATARRRRLER